MFVYSSEVIQALGTAENDIDKICSISPVDTTEQYFSPPRGQSTGQIHDVYASTYV